MQRRPRASAGAEGCGGLCPCPPPPAAAAGRRRCGRAYRRRASPSPLCCHATQVGVGSGCLDALACLLRGGSTGSKAPREDMLRCRWSCPVPLPAGGGPSQECLVTLVMNVDLGGWLSRGSLLRRVGRPLADTLLRAWLEPMLLSVVMLRDKVGGCLSLMGSALGLRSCAGRGGSLGSPGTLHHRCVGPHPPLPTLRPARPPSVLCCRWSRAASWCALTRWGMQRRSRQRLATTTAAAPPHAA